MSGTLSAYIFQNGLQTCANRNGIDEEIKQTEKGGLQYVYTKVEDICAQFKHDKVPALKGKIESYKWLISFELKNLNQHYFY